ncbi:MAG: hypothetical protein JWQ04_772 [Pedosphaera sp.]|nr:hypothetical protein [Pedosphaera sp.]
MVKKRQFTIRQISFLTPRGTSGERIRRKHHSRIEPLNHPQLRKILECGGKRSATPLSEAERNKNFTGANRGNREGSASPWPCAALSVTSVSSCSKFGFMERAGVRGVPHSMFSVRCSMFPGSWKGPALFPNQMAVRSQKLARWGGVSRQISLNLRSLRFWPFVIGPLSASPNPLSSCK